MLNTVLDEKLFYHDVNHGSLVEKDRYNETDVTDYFHRVSEVVSVKI